MLCSNEYRKCTQDCVIISSNYFSDNVTSLVHVGSMYKLSIKAQRARITLQGEVKVSFRFSDALSKKKDSTKIPFKNKKSNFKPT